MSDTAKLTKARIRVLRLLIEGCRIIMNPVTGVFYLRYPGGSTSVLMRGTIFALIAAEFISRATLKITVKGKKESAGD